jgi:DNA adenine methylase Dam
MKPIIKWVGGKSQLLDKIKEMRPSGFDPNKNMYYEPFLGGGAVLLELNPSRAIVSDINPELINVYQQVRDNVEIVISDLSKFDRCHEGYDDPKDFYYGVRNDFNKYLGSNTPTQAARFIYLNKHCFNGLYRVNSRGCFNVPFNGKYTGESCHFDHLRAVSKQIQKIHFQCTDFEITVHDALPGDFVFIDSPYAPLTPTSFVDYTKEGFSYEDHKRLADFYKEMSDYGVYCMLTNHDTELIRDLYRGFNFTEVDVRRSINRNGDGRKGKEVIITNY